MQCDKWLSESVALSNSRSGETDVVSVHGDKLAFLLCVIGRNFKDGQGNLLLSDDGNV